MIVIFGLVGFWLLVIVFGVGVMSCWFLGMVIFGGYLIFIIFSLFLVLVFYIFVKEVEVCFLKGEKGEGDFNLFFFFGEDNGEFVNNFS